MHDRDIRKVLAEARPVMTVLLRARRWLTAPQLSLRLAWESADENSIWRIDMLDEDEASWHTFYTEAAEIVGISVDRSGEPTDGE